MNPVKDPASSPCATAPPPSSRAEYRCAMLGTSRIVFGSDHPIADDYLDRAVALLAGFSEEERTQIGRLNAEVFFAV